MRKEEVIMDAWVRDVAPSTELRRWFGHDPAKWDEFRRRYFAELDAHPAAWHPLLDAARKGNVTLLYSSRETEHNNAAALKEYLNAHLTARLRLRNVSKSTSASSGGATVTRLAPAGLGPALQSMTEPAAK
jgi:uncharacterized protein YeaO (DUF488 family)